MTNDRGYPPCANPDCGHTLCFLDRRDWNECPACGTPIPPELRLNDDMTGPRSKCTGTPHRGHTVYIDECPLDQS